MGVIELPDDVVIYPDGETYTGDGSEDWIKGLRGWPFPDVSSAEEMREKLREWGTTPANFRSTLLYRRWVDRIPWLTDL